MEVAEYWDVSPDFNYVAQCLVDQLMPQLSDDYTTSQLTQIQQINRQLLVHRYVSRDQMPELWDTLKNNVEEIAARWAPLDRFYLEVGDHYALLVDQTRKPSGAQPFIVAIAVAKLLGAGVYENELNELIKKTVSQMSATANITTTQVKQALEDYDLAEYTGDLIIATPLIERFAVTDEKESQNDEIGAS